MIVILNDNGTYSSYKVLLQKLHMSSLVNRRVQDMFIHFYECLNGLALLYLSLCFVERNTLYAPRGVDK